MLRLLLILLASPLVLGSNEFGVKFLEDNAKKDGVISLPSGLQYKVLRTGDGDSHPTADSSCECHYEGRTAENYPSGEKFDSSYDRGSPTSFAPNQVIKGWTEAMQLMVEGDKCTSPPDPSARPPDTSARRARSERTPTARRTHTIDSRPQVGNVHSFGPWLRRPRLATEDRRRLGARLHHGDHQDQRQQSAGALPRCKGLCHEAAT